VMPRPGFPCGLWEHGTTETDRSSPWDDETWSTSSSPWSAPPQTPHTPVPDHHQGEGRGTARRRCPDAHDPSAVRSHPRDLGDARRDRANPHHVHPLRHASAPWARCDDVASIHHRDRRSLGAERGGEAQTWPTHQPPSWRNAEEASPPSPLRWGLQHGREGWRGTGRRNGGASPVSVGERVLVAEGAVEPSAKTTLTACGRQYPGAIGPRELMAQVLRMPTR
jgi:hypothetical protein